MYKKEILQCFHKAYTVRTRMTLDSTVVRVIAFHLYEAHRYMILDITGVKYNGDMSAELSDLIDLIGERLSADDLSYMLKVNFTLLPVLYQKNAVQDIMLHLDQMLVNIVNYLDGRPAQFADDTDTVVISALIKGDVMDTVSLCFPIEGV